MDAHVACETVMESRMALLHVLLEEGVEPAVLVPLFELLATEAAAALGPDHALTMEADLGAQLCREAPATRLTEFELLAHLRLLSALQERLPATDGTVRADVEQLVGDLSGALRPTPVSA